LTISPEVFISYSHKDKKWRDDLDTHLKPYLRDGSITSWSDQQIGPGSQWFREIQSALTNSKIAVLLVSPDFLASDFIHEHELAPILKEAEQGGVKILWVPIRDSAYRRTPLNNCQAVLSPNTPLAAMTRAKRDQAWVTICEEIGKAVTPPVGPSSGRAAGVAGQKIDTLGGSTRFGH
jgi:internalin A